MKKLINNPESVVKEALSGMLNAHGDLIDVSFEPVFITRRALKKGKPAVLGGGGSGHEPLHGGFVGQGMLDAACPGHVFTSPTPDQMAEATKKINSGNGVLYLVKNYTGDVINFQMAEDISKDEGIDVESVLIDDDVALRDSLCTTGRRGVGGTVLIEKIVGAKAETETDLKTLAELARKLNASVRSMGAALTSCTVPSAGKPTFEIGDDEIEMGVGLHGEPGRTRIKLKPADELVDEMLDAIVTDLPFKSGDTVILMLNGMGGTPLIELYLLFNHVVEVLNGKNIKIARSLVGNYITSLEMQGFSITALRSDSEIISLWDAPVLTPALRWGL